MTFILSNISLIMYMALLALLIYAVTNLCLLLFFLSKARTWTPVVAILKDARVVDKNVGASMGFKNLKSTTYFFAQYEVNGRQFGCTRASFYLHDSMHARQMIRSLKDKIGEKITLYASTSEPHMSVLIPPSDHKIGKEFCKVLLLIVAIIFMLHWLSK